MTNTTRKSAEEPCKKWWERYSESRENAENHSLNVFVRSLRPPPGGHEHRQSVFQRIRTADERGAVDEFAVKVTGEELCLCHRCEQHSQPLQRTVQELATWRDGGLSASGFNEREINCSLTDERYRVLVPPETAIGIYLDGSLEGVFPCVVEHTQYTIEAFLTALLKDQPPSESADPKQPHQLAM